MYNLYIFGGSIGEQRERSEKDIFIFGIGHGRYSGMYKTRKEAKDQGKRYVSSFSGGSRNYYRPKYRIIEVKKAVTSRRLRLPKD